MKNESEIIPPRKRPKGVTFLFAGVALFLLDGAVSLFVYKNSKPAAFSLLAAGVLVTVLALFWRERD